MSTTPGRDRDVEQLLRRVMPASAASTPDCLDAETLAAWADDGLGVQARAAAEAHVAGCARCQALLAVIVRTTPEVVPPLPWWRASFVRWMTPALVTIGAATLWFLLPHPEPVAPAEDIQLQARADSRLEESPATAVREAPPLAVMPPVPAGGAAAPPAVLQEAPSQPDLSTPRIATPSDARPKARPPAAPAFSPDVRMRETVVAGQAAAERAAANVVANVPEADERASSESLGKLSARTAPARTSPDGHGRAACRADWRGTRRGPATGAGADRGAVVRRVAASR